MKYRQFMCFCALLFCTSNHAWSVESGATLKSGEAEELFPTYNATYYSGNVFSEQYFEHVGAVTGKIISIEPGPEGKLILELELTDVEKKLWVATINKILEGQMIVGNTIDVLGFFDETQKEQQYMAKITDEKEYLIGFCFNVHETNLPIYRSHLLHHCLAWEQGKLDVQALERTLTK